jgi:hypothetical protein
MLIPSSSLLILIDMQVKLSNVMYDRAMLYKNTKIIVRGCRILDIPILWLEQYPQGLGGTIPELVHLLVGCSPIAKTSFSALRDPVVRARFEKIGRSQVLLTGIETHVCIYQTAMDLVARGIEAHVVADAVSSRTENNKQIGLAKIQHAGGLITSTETVLFELLGEAKGERFKQILELLK